MLDITITMPDLEVPSALTVEANTTTTEMHTRTEPHSFGHQLGAIRLQTLN